ncbi:MAG TPA: bifunctional methionine sulfoxide reductase B/A protein [Defluviitoga sp.]|nr:bifunctional methionine sulfoxide reductase B/A protein [Defluviitoga sp.]HOP24151.1 bifunctional methionine sulfoxide reductase B/A protein [Defluviitoga sp.]HPZ28515.1 bifunctional methionine sulfoxide reductase B/A protein [Defluviitoga sp.]HQD62447.1 bifunctional methionine sulfoxide reductase B/A protein [Defluviitoga sp.]
MDKKLNKLTSDEYRVIIEKGTEKPFTGKYNDFFEEGVYICKQCHLPLYKSENKFKSESGWPSFDKEIPSSIRRQLDEDGERIEIVCSYCGAHLGHVFESEGYTKTNIRHCVNSISMEFVPIGTPLPRQRAIFAAGCFWGVEYMFRKVHGVIDVVNGYTGGFVEKPTYQQVCTGKTGHAEAVLVIFDPNIVGYEELVRYFFEIHDPTQIGGQGPDIGDQYRSEIFYTDEEQKLIAEKVIKELTEKGMKIVTKVTEASNFYKAEEYHQNYYEKTKEAPYCHFRRNIFNTDYIKVII